MLTELTCKTYHSMKNDDFSYSQNNTMGFLKSCFISDRDIESYQHVSKFYENIRTQKMVYSIKFHKQHKNVPTKQNFKPISFQQWYQSYLKHKSQLNIWRTVILDTVLKFYWALLSKLIFNCQNFYKFCFCMGLIFLAFCIDIYLN